MRHPITNGQFYHAHLFTLQSCFIMKNTVLNLIAFVLLFTSFAACKKETAFKDRLVGQWQSTQVMAGTSDVTSTYDFDLNLEKTMEFDLDVVTTVPFTGKVTQSYSGDWEDDESKQDITLFYSDGAKKTWEVVLISDTRLTVELVENNTRYQVKFERK